LADALPRVLGREADEEGFREAGGHLGAIGRGSAGLNRILQEFRVDALITLEQGKLTLRNVVRLQGIAEFDQDHLQLGGAPPEMTRYFDQLDRDAAIVPQPPDGGRR
jgi:hypothetical protein